MLTSTFEIFKPGLGPSSSHTMGPMTACSRFLHDLKDLHSVTRVVVEVYGSLALTGIGHGTDKAILMGLEGDVPLSIDPEMIDARVKVIRDSHRLLLGGQHTISFNPHTDLLFSRKQTLPLHPNGMLIRAFKDEQCLKAEVYYSIGGGQVCTEAEMATRGSAASSVSLPYAFRTAGELLATAQHAQKSILAIAEANELAQRSQDEITAKLDSLAAIMLDSIERGCQRQGMLPGKLHVRRRAHELWLRLNESERAQDPLLIMDKASLYAMAVSEENATGSRIVTAPTNGAAGIIPAVLRHAKESPYYRGPETLREFLLVSGTIGLLYAWNASLSGAEVGCQGEVGVACSMAAAGLAAVMGGSNAQIEQAAEIGMEHNLGLTCDPIGGLVQIPCIERNAVAAVKAISAARMAINSDGQHIVSLDQVMKTMMQTGADMKTKYKETSRGGLAVNFIEC
jgi:L-serine dehydratase